MRLACGQSQVQSSGWATFVRGDWSRNNFYGHSLPTTDSSGAVVRYWRKDEHLVVVNCLGSLPRNSVVRLIDHLDMTVVVDWDVKPKFKLTNILKRPTKIILIYSQICCTFSIWLDSIQNLKQCSAINCRKNPTSLHDCVSLADVLVVRCWHQSRFVLNNEVSKTHND